MKLNIKVQDYRAHIDFWLTLFQSGAGITDREKTVVLEILCKRDELSRDGIKEPHLTKLLFDTDARKEYCERLDITAFSLNNTIKALKDKGVLSDEFEMQYTLIPSNKLEIDFKYGG